jgi:hypothetical protein
MLCIAQDEQKDLAATYYKIGMEQQCPFATLEYLKHCNPNMVRIFKNSNLSPFFLKFTFSFTFYRDVSVFKVFGCSVKLHLPPIQCSVGRPRWSFVWHMLVGTTVVSLSLLL